MHEIHEVFVINLLTTNIPHHAKTSQLICIAIGGTLVIHGLTQHNDMYM